MKGFDVASFFSVSSYRSVVSQGLEQREQFYQRVVEREEEGRK